MSFSTKAVDNYVERMSQNLREALVRWLDFKLDKK
jgi:hypothetical protein